MLDGFKNLASNVKGGAKSLGRLASSNQTMKGVVKLSIESFIVFTDKKI